MCGILAMYSKRINKDLFKKSLDLMTHRGPDDSGLYFKDDIALGHRRLSIIDLSENAHQPMSNENKNLWITYNGEIYNFKELRKELEDKHTFKSNSDTEVIIHAYEEWGNECVEKFNGMFAFVIYNSTNNKLFIARDRTGIKPLYYYSDEEKIIFSSEIKSMFPLGVAKEINKDILYDYINYQILIGEETLIKNVFSFPPGHYTTIDKNGMIKVKYWDTNFTDDNIEDNLKDILEQSVKRQLISDVPVGAFLSGGIDSSTIVALAKKHKPDIKTFTVGFDDFPDEIEAAKFTAKELGVENYSISLSAEQFIEELPKIIYQYDMPLSFASSVPLYFVSKLARDNNVKVVLTGEGADELFAGYRRYNLIQKVIRLSKFIPGVMIINFSDPRYYKMAEMLMCGFTYDYLTGINSIIGEDRQKIIKFNKSNILRDKVKEIFDSKQTDFTNKLLYLDFKTYLVELLMKQDKMSMAASIESRVPFLDNEVIDFANSIPSNLKLHNGKGKYILKESVKDILPKSIINRKKVGFSVPLNKWFKGKLNGYIKEQLLGGDLDEYFNRDYIEKLIKKKNNSLQLWALLNFKIWKDVVLK